MSVIRTKHDFLVCLRTCSTIADINLFRRHSEKYHYLFQFLKLKNILILISGTWAWVGNSVNKLPREGGDIDLFITLAFK